MLFSWENLASGLGLVGVVLIVVSYLQLQRGAWKHLDLIYLWFNLMGAVLIMVSLSVDWNLSAFIIEVFWLGISGYGFWKRTRHVDK